MANMKKYSYEVKTAIKRANALESDLGRSLVWRRQLTKLMMMLLPSLKLRLMLLKKNFTRLCRI